MKTKASFANLRSDQKAFALESLRRLSALRDQAVADGDLRMVERADALSRHWRELLWLLL